MEEKKTRHLYKVDYPIWVEPTFVTARDQAEAIQRALEGCWQEPGIDSSLMSVSYIGEVLI